MRLFIAIELPDEHVNLITALQRSLDGSNWERHPHITLCHFGDVSVDRVDELTELLVSVDVPRLTITPSVVGYFPNADEPAVLWIGLEPNPELHSLAGNFGSIRKSFVGGEDRLEFTPHITLARTGSVEPIVVRQFAEELDLTGLTPFTVDGVGLFASDAGQYRKLRASPSLEPVAGIRCALDQV